MFGPSALSRRASLLVMMLWAAGLACGHVAEVSGCLRAGAALATAALLGPDVPLLVAAVPWERVLPGACDTMLQHATAVAASWLLGRGGRPAPLTSPVSLAASAEVTVQVSQACAGVSTLLALLTLGLVLGRLVGRHRLLLALAAPGLGAVTNLLRVAVCVWAAARWGGTDVWLTVHDGLTWAIFGGFYAALTAGVLVLRRRTSASPSAAAAGNNVPSPQRT